MSKKLVYHIGDLVRIINPQFVKRVGYPLVFKDLIPEFENHPKLHEAMVMLGLANEDDMVNPRSKIAKDFIVGCAKAAVRRRGFGGPKRSIYYTEEVPFYFSTEDPIEIVGKRVVKTGVYFPPYSGGLSHVQSHVLLMTVFGEIEEKT